MNKILLLLLFILITFSCKPQKTSKIDKVMYLFTDASLPIPQQRNYEITVTPKIGGIKIIGNDTVYKNISYTITASQWEEIVKAAEEANLKGLLYSDANQKNCMSYTIASFNKEQPLGIYEWSSCNETTVQQKYTHFKTCIVMSVPDLNALLSSTK